MKAGLGKNMILNTAVKLADEKGIAYITIKSLAEKLGVKPPSLYKHISGLDELNQELMLYGWKLLEEEMMRSAVGKSKDDAVIAMCYAYRNFVALHGGLFEAMQWYNMYKSERHLQATERIVSLLFQVFDAYDLREEQKVHAVRMLRGFLQGFLSIESHNGFGNPLNVNDTFDFSLKIFLDGIRNLKGEKSE